MSGLLSALNAGKTSMFTNQKQIEITSNNITNVNTPGYSRQKATLSPFPSLDFNGFFVGQGVKIAGIEREQDIFLTRQLKDKNALLGEEEGRTAPLAELERVFNLTEQNLGAEIDAFFDSWGQLASNPGGQIERDLVIRRGNLLADAFHVTTQEMDNVLENVNNTIVSRVDALNSKLLQVAELNKDIVGIESTGQTANSARDQRDQILEELTYSLGVQSYEENNGMISVQLPGGIPLVQSGEALTLSGTMAGSNLVLEVQEGGAALPVGIENLGGEFKGLMDLSTNLIPQLKNDLDKLAWNISNSINTQHQLGTDLNNLAGGFFFADLGAVVTNASQNISMVITSTNDIAAGATSAPGDNTNAQAISALAATPIVDGSDTFGDFYGKITTTVGIEANQNRLTLAGAEDAMVQLRNLRDGKLGVSLEEEMINLLKFQQGFEAAAKLLATVDEMLTTVLSIKR